MNIKRATLPTITALALALSHGAADGQEGTGAADGTADDSADNGAGQPDDGAKPDVPDDAASASDVDVDGLRQEYLKLRDQLFRSRARAAAVASALYSSRLTVHLDYGTGRFYTVGRATIRVDGANVFDDADGAIAENKAPRFEGYIAPGRHLVTIRIEAAGRDDDRFTSATESTFVVQAVAGKDLLVRAKAGDDGDIPFKWKKKEQGTYKLQLDVSVQAVKRGKKGDGRIRRASR